MDFLSNFGHVSKCPFFLTFTEVSFRTSRLGWEGKDRSKVPLNFGTHDRKRRGEAVRGSREGKAKNTSERQIDITSWKTKMKRKKRRKKQRQSSGLFLLPGFKDISNTGQLKKTASSYRMRASLLVKTKQMLFSDNGKTNYTDRWRANNNNNATTSVTRYIGVRIDWPYAWIDCTTPKQWEERLYSLQKPFVPWVS